MDVREKLVGLLTDNLPRIGNLPKCDNPLQYTMDEIVERIADHLIAHGVTVQEWISVKDRLPDDERQRVLAICIGDFQIGHPKIDTDRYTNGHWVRYGNDVTYWQYLPQPPKGE